MRLFLNKHYFISVIQKFPEFESSPNTMVCDSSDDKAMALQENDFYFSCQVMNLVHGMGMQNAKITDNQFNVVACIVHNHFSETHKNCNSFDDVAKFHLQCLIEL